MSKLALIFPSEESKDHWMTKRMIRRAGLENEVIHFHIYDSKCTLDWLNKSNVEVAVLMGEQVLESVHGKRDILRWFNRVVDFPLKDRTIKIIPCLEPKLLLARKSEEDEQGRKKRGLRHPPRYQGAVVRCLQRAFRGEFPVRISTTYLEDPPVARFAEWVELALENCQSKWLSWDIETLYKMKEEDEEEYEERKRQADTNILRISFAWEIGKAVSVPWNAQYLPHIKKLLEEFTGFHITWNGLQFDVPIIAEKDIIPGGVVLDGMDAFHLYQSDLDKGLEVVTSYFTCLLPWKHLSDSDPALYSCIDSDAALRNMVGIQSELERLGLWDRFIKEMYIMNFLNEAGQRGNYVNEQFRQDFKRKLQTLLLECLKSSQELVPEKFQRTKYLRRIPKSDPDGWNLRSLPTKQTECSLCHKPNVTIKHKCELGEGWEKLRVVVETPHYFRRPNPTQFTTLEEINEYFEKQGFNPCSSHQILGYMKAHKHPVGKNHKTDNDTADVKHLKKLVKRFGDRHPIYGATLKIRLLQKALSTYVNGLEPDQANLVHCHYTNSPSTWRLGCRNFNAQNLGRRDGNPYARDARRIIVPRPGHVLVEADSSSIEAVMTGWFMEDERYTKIARQGVHAWLCCMWLGLAPTKENMKKVKEENPNGIYDQLKRVVHGTSYGMGPYLMHMNEPETFPTLADAKKAQNFLFKQLPSLQNWHRELQIFAQKNGYLENPWKFRHYFYDVFTYQHDDEGNLIPDDEGRPKIKLGKDGKSTIAFKPQSSAGFFMRDNIYLLGQTEARAWMPAIVSIHDGYTLDVPENKVNIAKEILVNILTRPIAEMDNIRIGCSVEVSLPHEQGGNFLELKTVDKVEVE